MKVQLICNLGSIEFPDTPYKDGEIRDVQDKLGEKLVKRGLAVALPEEKTVEAEPEKPAPVKAVKKAADINTVSSATK